MKIKNNFIASIYCLGCLFFLKGLSGETATPNILFIHMEDMGIQIPAYGDYTVVTPQLDRLANEGVIFNRAQVTAATCSSSRGSLFTGLYPHQNGIMGFINHHGFRFREGVPTYIQALKKAGYQCGLTYKTGIMPESSVPFDFMVGANVNKLTGDDSPASANNGIDNFRLFLQDLYEGTPFYFQAQTPDTHATWAKPEVIKPGSKGWPYPDVDLSRVRPLPSFGDDFELTPQLTKLMGSYYGAIQRVDWYVGQLLDLLEEFGLTESTLVIFSADHGPSEFMRGKTTPYEDGLQVPFIVRWPGITKPGTRSDTMVSFVDLFPTFLEVAGLERPSYLPGYSLVSVFKGKPTRRKFLYSAYNAHTTGKALYWPTRTVNDGLFKLIHNLNGDGKTRRPAKASKAFEAALEKMSEGSLARKVAARSDAPPEFELYDLENDPGELFNLIDNPKYRKTEKKLRDQLWHWRKEVVLDPFCNPKYLARFNADYEMAIIRMAERIKELGGKKPSRTGWHLDWSEHTHPWDPTPYNFKD
jgi:N-sulfoglucosamine sulfohydrolase